MRVRRAVLFTEAAVALTLARLASVLPFRWMVARQAALSSGLTVPLASPSDQRAVAVGRAVGKVEARLPWHSSCLILALAARLMLWRRGIPTVLHFGIGRGEDGRLTAHAWLEAAGGYVCGGREAPDFVPLASFASARR